MEGFSESLAFELRPLEIKVKCIEPGAIKTDFYTWSQDLFKNDTITDYDRFEQIALANTQKEGENHRVPKLLPMLFTKLQQTKNKTELHGWKPKFIFACLRRILPENTFFSIVRKVVEKAF